MCALKLQIPICSSPFPFPFHFLLLFLLLFFAVSFPSSCILFLYSLTYLSIFAYPGANTRGSVSRGADLLFQVFLEAHPTRKEVLLLYSEFQTGEL